MPKKITVLAFLVGAALPAAAHAQSWGDFSAAFPLFPCQDGWVGCVVEGQPVTPDLQRDGTGAPVPAHMRVGWFDLQPTRSFSPFVSLSRYTGAPVPTAGDAVADAAPPPVPEEPPAPRQPSAEELAAQEQARLAAQEAAQREAERRAAEEAARKAAAEQEAQRRAAEDAERRKRELEAQAKAAADAAEADRLRKQAEEEARRAREAEEARKRAEEEARKREEERIAKQKAEEEARRKAEEEAAELARLKAEEEARRQAEEEARKKAEAEAAAKKAEEEADVADQRPPPDAGAAEEANCEPGNLVRLEPMAMMGKMSLAQIKACESSLQAAARMTDKEKISRVLMVNAFAKGDAAGWEQLIKRHLDEIDQSDPEICYKYAMHLSKGGPSRATGVIRWANVALENRTVWTGDTYTSRVYNLYKLRAAAAQGLWQQAENNHATSPSDTTKKRAEDYRNQTKVMAREWYEYAKAAGKDTTKALELCMAAAGTADYCEGG